MQKTPIEKQWEKLKKQEMIFLKKCMIKSPSKVDDFISEKIPDKLQGTLKGAFSKSFEIVFEKGTGIIEKSYNKENKIFKHKMNMYAYSLKPDRRQLRNFDIENEKSQVINVAFSGVKGMSLGLLGIGVPDIPIFVGMVLKGIYEIALQYGYGYKTEEERYFILQIITASLSDGTEVVSRDEELNSFIMHKTLPDNYDRRRQIDMVSEVLSTELLCMKFIQGVPVVGVVGGVADAVFVNHILKYAKLKYKHRFLYDNIKGLPQKNHLKGE